MLGQVVLSKAGKDSGSFYVVLREEGDFAYIADGRRRSVLNPKRKNPLHLASTAQKVPVSDAWTDKKIRHLLWELNFGTSQPVTEKEET